MFINMNKRRSSLKYGRRRSRSLGSILTKDICSTIDKSLPPSERLKSLLSFAIETALSAAEKEFYEGEDVDLFQKNCSECQDKINSSLDSQNLYSLAVSDDELTNSSFSTKNTFPQFHAAMNKLEKENKAWDRLEANYKSYSEKGKDISSIPYKGSFDYKGYGNTYSQLLKNILSISEQTKYQLEELRENRLAFLPFKGYGDKYIDYMNTKVEDYFVNVAQESPRTLIKKCFADVSNDY